MKRSKKLGSKLIALMLALMMVAAYVPMVGDVAYAATGTSITLNKEATAEGDLPEYKMAEPIMVTANSAGGDSWVGLYKKGAISGESIYWYWTKDHEGKAANLLEQVGGKVSLLGEGEFTLVLYDSDGSTIDKTVDFRIVEQAPAMELSADSYTVGEPIKVLATSSKAGAWVGFYEKGADVTAYKDYYSLRDGNDKWKTFTAAKAGDYSVILFGNSDYDIQEKVINFTVKAPVISVDPNEEEDAYPEYEITLVPEEVLEAPFVENGLILKNAYTTNFAEGLNIKITAPADANENMWIGIYDYDWNPEKQQSLAWSYVKSYAGTTIDNSTTFDLASVWEDQDANDGQYKAGIRKLVLFKDGGYTVVDTKYFKVRVDASGTPIELSDAEFTYNGEIQAPSVVQAGGYKYDAVIPDSVDAGEYTVTVKFKGTYGGKSTANYKILPKELVSEDITVVTDQKYDGEAVKAVVKYGTTVLEEGKDFTATYTNNDKAGEATIAIEFKGNYAGEVIKTFNVECAHKWVDGEVKTEPTCTAEGVKELVCEYGCGATDTAPVAIDENAHDWDEGVVTKAATCTAEGVKTFTCKHDASHTDTAPVAIDENAHDWDEGVVTKAATCTAEGVKTFTCKHDASHTDTAPVAIDENAHDWDGGVVTKAATCTAEGVKTFTCKHNDAHTDTAVIAIDPAAHNYKESVTEPTCTEQGYTTYACECGDEYTANYVDVVAHKTVKTEAKAATCEVDGNIEYYTCEVCKKFFAEAEGKTELTADKLIVTAAGHTLGEFQTVEKAGFDKEGKQEAKCVACDYVEPKAIAAAVVPAIKDQTFNKKTKSPTVTVMDAEGNKIDSKATFATKSRKSVGKYKVTVKLTGADYEGTKTVYFKINPAGKSISKLTAGKKAFTVKWSKPSSTYRKQMSGYQIKYSTSSKMTSAKTVTVKGTSATSKTIKKLKAKKYYYVQLRTYKTVKGVKYYSSWSKTKKVKTK